LRSRSFLLNLSGLQGVYAAILLFALAANGTPVAAGTINGAAEVNYNEANMSLRNPGETNFSGHSQNLSQLYRLNLQTDLATKLRLTAGGLFGRDLTKNETGEEPTVTALNRWQPRADLYFTDTLLRSSLGGSRRQESHSANGRHFSLINEEYHGYGNWRPEGLPQISLRLQQADNYDAARQEQDTRRRSGALSLRYNTAKNLDLRYQFAYEESDNHLLDFATREKVHSGGASYSGDLAGRRVVYSAGLNFNHLAVTMVRQGNGEYVQPRPGDAGLSALGFLPATTSLAANRLLNDSDLTTSAGIDIGTLDANAATTSQWRNLGLDFTLPVTVNHLRVQLNRELLEPIAAAFVWEIYSSEDNQEWVLRQSLAAAPFDPFEKRFDLRFLPVTSRYLKVALRPLSPVIALQYPQEDWQSIPVTELQAFYTQPVADLARESASTSETGTFDLRIRLSESPSLYYRGSLLAGHRSETENFRYTLVNSLNLEHPLSPTLTTTASVGREESNNGTVTTAAYLLSSALHYLPLPQASASLTYSGRIEPQAEGTEISHSLYFYALTQPYTGINISFGSGINQKVAANGDKNLGTTLNTTTSLVPNQALSLDFGYALSRSRQSNDEITMVSLNQHGDAMLNLRLTRALALFAGLAIDDESGRSPQLLRNFGSSWVPFPDGTLHFGFSWNENWRSSDNSWTRSIVPSVNWRVTPRTMLQLSAPAMTTRTDDRTMTIHAVNANLKTSF
jgi:hypothetical protein